MRAAVLDAYGEELAIREVADPRPGPGEVLIRVRAVGLCGSDLKVASGAIPNLTLPLIPGHEIAGEVVEDGEGLRAGQRVSVYALDSCGACPSCRRGEAETCDSATRMGFERDGGLAELLAAPAHNVIPLDPGLSFERAAVTMDAVLTAYRALKVRAAVKAGDAVLIVGAGGLGLHGVQVARAAGARVAVADPLASHRELALELGAERAFAPEELVAGLAAWRDEGVDVALEVSGSQAGFRQAADSLRPGGLLVCSGYRPGEDYCVDSMRLALSQLRIEGNRGGRIEHAREALAAVGRGEIVPLIDTVGSFDQVNELLAKLRAGDVVGRVVVAIRQE